MAFAALATLVAPSFAPSLKTPADYEVTSLPGLASKPSFKHYAGLVPINDDKGTELFFWFVESARSPADDPLVFWTNGGPGASSVAYGFWTEHGPFRLENGTSGVAPVPYDYSWNRIANVLYVEMPSGVGFSHSADPGKYANITDAAAAADTYAFLQAWLEIFSDYRANDFFVTSESYGGHYVPMIATAILDGGGPLLRQTKGFLIGNPGINSDWYYNVNEFAFITCAPPLCTAGPSSEPSTSRCSLDCATTPHYSRPLTPPRACAARRHVVARPHPVAGVRARQGRVRVGLLPHQLQPGAHMPLHPPRVLSTCSYPGRPAHQLQPGAHMPLPLHPPRAPTPRAPAHVLRPLHPSRAPTPGAGTRA